jgi:tetratricopeptide (TPR) repeat protein
MLLSLAPPGAPVFAPPLDVVASQWCTRAAWESAAKEEKKQYFEQQLVPALRYHLLARDLCPLMAKPQIRLAGWTPYFVKADPALAYLDRAKRVVTNDPELYFLFGTQEILLGQKERAAQSWRRTLELDDKNLKLMLELGRTTLSPGDWADAVLPDRPQLLVAAALYLYPRPDQQIHRQPILEKALGLIQAQTSWRDGQSFYLEALAHRHLGQVDKALTAYGEAVTMEPRRPAWRLEYATLLHAEGHPAEARRELYRILTDEPGFRPARDLLLSLGPDESSSRRPGPGEGPPGTQPSPR